MSAVDLDRIVFLLEGRTMPLGTKRQWKGGTFVKTKEGWVKDTASAEPAAAAPGAEKPKLTDQERVFMAMYGDGHSGKRIAQAMRLSRDTVLRMSHGIRLKLGLTPMDDLRAAAKKL